MKYRVKVSNDAYKDLLELEDYLLPHFSNEVTIKSLQSLIKNYSALSDFPQKGKPAELLNVMLEGFYFLPLPQNIIFYKVLEKENTVLIYRIYSTRENFIKDFLYYVQEQ